MLKFCIICGKRTSELFDNMCKECYIKSHVLVELPKATEVKMCPFCFSYFYKGKWIRPEGSLEEVLKEAIARVLLARARINAKIVKDFDVEILRGLDRALSLRSTNLLVKVVIRGSAHPKIEPYLNEEEVRVKLVWKYCPACFKIKVKKEEAIVQVRATNRRLSEREKERIVNSLEALIDRLYEESPEAVILDYEEVEGGINIKLSSKKIARAIASFFQREYLATIKETYKIIGMVQGKEKAKETISIRLPKFKIGDIIKIKNRFYLVKDIGNGRVYALDIEHGLPTSIKGKELKRATLIEHERIPAMIVSIGRETITIMRLDNYETIELELKSYGEHIGVGSIVDLVRIEDKFFIIKSD